MIRSFRRGTPASFRPRRGLRSLDTAVRDDLRLAVVGRLPRERLRPEAGEEGLMLTRALRQVGKRGGIPVGQETDHDAEMAVFLFEDASTAVRNASMRKLLERRRRVQRPALDGGPGHDARLGPGRGLGGQAGQQAPAWPPWQAPPRAPSSCASAPLAAPESRPSVPGYSSSPEAESPRRPSHRPCAGSRSGRARP